MAQARKFGAFAGVFTPSILTILGVIMYLRLPSIVGQAGLLQAFGIIAVAHIISVATGLSVSSIATDKRVKAGGTYYIISRSLGLAMGGTLGLALFVGLSFSVSMYLVGFSESFLGVWGLPVNASTIRLTGSIMLAVVTTVTLISTALALKMQFWIMAAIALSLVSILLGRHEMVPAASQIRPLAEAAPFIVLFGIFFPAVTGFEAGVSMSGDLKDPKRAIPGGTISAILVGLLVYLGLVAFLAFTVDRQELANNPNVLLEMSFFPPLVVAGIWGATISSAFGSILGAPRILQATAADGISPRWFAKGYGKENEPRHALVLAFVIAWAGILIGELDVIARIVSMFFIMTYGFLNLTAAIESWVSPDFRPEFRVPRFVAIIGSIACFVVMIQLDFLAMLGASVLLAGLYLVLTRRQLRLETGDTWEGVWSSLARSALLRLNAGLGHLRNWRPNVLLFSGGAAARPHLIEFAMQLAGSRGLVTNFQLVEEGAGSTDKLADGAPWGVFTRQVECADVYTGVAEIADHYGFVGIEPNTVVMGWARDSRDPERFASLLQHLVNRDLNILLLDYDRERHWGKRERIDVWWRLTGSDVSFSLALIRFLGNADEWQDVTVRFLTVNDHDSAWNASILRDMALVLEEHRVEAEVRVIDNMIEKRPFSDIIRGESIDADLTVLGLSDMREGDATRFIADMNSVVDVLGTVVLARASSFFAEPLVRASAALSTGPAERREEPEHAAVPEPVPEDIEITAPESVATLARSVGRELMADVVSARDEYVRRIGDTDRAFLNDIGALALDVLTGHTRHEVGGGVPGPEAVAAARGELVQTACERIEQERTAGIAARGALLTGFGHRLGVAIAAQCEQAPEWLDVLPRGDEVGGAVRKRGLFRRKPGHRTQARMLLEAQLRPFAARAYGALLDMVAADAARTAVFAQRWIERTLAASTDPEDMRMSTPADAMRAEIAEALRQSKGDEARFIRTLESQVAAAVVAFARDAGSPGTRRMRQEARRAEDAAQTEIARIDAAVDALTEAIRLSLNGLEIGVRLVFVRDQVRTESVRAWEELQAAILDPTVGRLERISRVLNEVKGSLDADAEAEVEAVAHYHPIVEANALLAASRDRIAALATELPASLEVISPETETALAEGHPEEVVAGALPVREVFEYLARAEVFAPLLDEVVRAVDEADDSAEVCREVAQLAAFELRSPDAAARTVTSDAGPETVIRSGMERTERELRRLEELRVSFGEKVRRRFDGLVARLDPFSISRVSARLHQYVRGERGRGLVGGLTRLRLRIGRVLAENATRLAYRRSEGVLLARRLEREGAGMGGPGARIRRLVAAVSPRTDVLDSLPTHYRQLFLGGAAVADDLVGFEAELAEADSAVQAHRRGAGGALFIVAEQGHGRATLSRLVTRQNFPRGAVFRIDPVEGGSINPQVFQRRLASSLKMSRDDAGRMMSRLPAGSTLVVNDLGLWWERSQDGNAVLDVICDLIERFGDRCLFVINANVRAFRLMNRIRPMDDRMLAIIELEPFHARELKELVLLRHGAGGLGYTIDGRPEAELSDWKLARFFDALFDYSNGNIGSALNAWIASIRGVEDDTVHVVTPKRPGLDAFTGLTPVQRMIAVQFLVHDRATTARLVRITRLDHAVLARELRVLQSCGLLVQSAGGVVQLDRFARPHFVRFLTQEGLL